MKILRKCFTVLVCLFVENSYVVLTLPVKTLATNSNADEANATVYSSRARMDGEFNLDGRIVGGFVTSIENYPYQVSVQYHNVHICGGSIVAENIILTAAHCIEEPWDTAAFRVRAGSSTHFLGGQLAGVRHIFKHEAYSTSTLDCDVALVVLDKNLIYTRTVQPVELAEWDEQRPNNERNFIVTGWGLTSETGVMSSLLNYVVVHLINQNICSKNYQYIATITTKMLCAGSPQGGKDSCQGDSGGPLVSYIHSQASTTSPSTLSLNSSLLPTKTTGLNKLQTKAMKAKQYGVVSWGVGCAEKSYPGVYANVATLRPWIDAKITQVHYL